MISKPSRVLHVISGMHLGGAESMIMNIYRRIDRKSIQFDFLVHTDTRCFFDDEIENLGGNIYHMKRLNGFNSLSYYNECKSFFQDHQELSIVHGHIGSSAALYLSAAKKTGKYTIAHSHGANIPRNFHDYAYKVFSFPTRYIADYLFGCSTEAGISRFGRRSVEKDNYSNFHNAIELDNYRFNLDNRIKIRGDFNIDQNAIVVGTVGRIEDQKNPGLIFNTFLEIVHNYDNAYCLWVGSGELYNEYVTKVKKAKYSDRIILTGRRNDVSELLQGFDGFILPSFWEGLPVSAIEAQAAGIPCLISDSVSKESAVTDLVEWESIQATPLVWSEHIMKMIEHNKGKRKSPIIELQRSGYDINQAAEWLTNFYIQRIGS